MSRNYSLDFYPPMPMLQVRLGIADTGLSTQELLGIVDTGADSTIVPIALLDEIEASIEGFSTARGPWGDSHPVNLYAVDAIIEGITLPGIIVIGDEEGDEVVLGRNVLNRLKMLLDGLKLQTDIVGY
jgi:predicted aspartyl protease